jgi:hypothetical protein
MHLELFLTGFSNPAGGRWTQQPLLLLPLPTRPVHGARCLNRLHLGGGPFDHYLAVFLTKVMVDAASMETSGWNLGRQVLQIKAELGGWSLLPKQAPQVCKRPACTFGAAQLDKIGRGNLKTQGRGLVSCRWREGNHWGPCCKRQHGFHPDGYPVGPQTFTEGPKHGLQGSTW